MLAIKENDGNHKAFGFLSTVLDEASLARRMYFVSTVVMPILAVGVLAGSRSSEYGGALSFNRFVQRDNISHLVDVTSCVCAFGASLTLGWFTWKNRPVVYTETPSQQLPSHLAHAKSAEDSREGQTATHSAEASATDSGK